jgi:LPS export ABC transporter protein LptC/lipopolysaccharide transport protein LptA
MSNVQRSFAVIRWIPRVLLIAVIGFSFYVGWSYSREKENEQQKEKIRLEQKRGRIPVARQDNIDYTHFDKGRMVYRVRAETVLTMKSEQQQLTNPEFIFYDERGKEQIRVTGKKCNISKDFNQITVYEDTLVKSENGMNVAAHMIRYDSANEQFSTPAAALFKWRTMRGKSKGFTYTIPEETLELPQNPEISYVNREDENRKPIVMTGQRGLIDRKSGFAYFEGEVEVHQGKDQITAHRIEASYKPGTNDLEKLTAIKNVHIQFGKPGKKERGENASKGNESAGGPVVQTPGMSNVFAADSESGKDLIAEYVELFFYEDGSTTRAFHSTGDCTFILHSYDRTNMPKENRIIKGQNFDAKFNRNGDMEEFKANEKVSVKLQPLDSPKRKQNAESQTIFCEDLTATFHADTGDVKDIHFNEAFKHVQGGRTITSNQAIYTGSAKKTDLIGKPEINDPSFTITAANMELFEETSGIHAKGNVKSAFVQSEGKTPSTFPFSSPSNQPVYISSEDMVWDSQKSEATYTEKAKLWQEKNVITASRIVINDQDKTLSAYEKVHTIFYNDKNKEEQPSTQSQETKKTDKKQDQTQTQTQQSQPVEGGGEEDSLIADSETMGSGPISVDSGIMNYAEKDRIIHFEKDVKIVTETTRINSERADFFLQKENSELDHLYAQGKVNIQHEQKKGTGNQATYYANDHRLVLEGNPKLKETGKADIVGRVLTLFLADDRILIDGQEDGRATTTLQMKGSFSPSTAAAKKEEGLKKDTPDARGKKAGSKKRKPN